MTTNLAEDELLVEAHLPLLAADTRFGFYEFSRRAGDYAIAMALVRPIGFRTALSPTRMSALAAPKDVRAASRKRKQRSTASRHLAQAFAAAAEAAAAAVDPLEDLQANAKYRRDLVRTVTRRALERAAA